MRESNRQVDTQTPILAMPCLTFNEITDKLKCMLSCYRDLNANVTIYGTLKLSFGIEERQDSQIGAIFI